MFGCVCVWMGVGPGINGPRDINPLRICDVKYKTKWCVRVHGGGCYGKRVC